MFEFDSPRGTTVRRARAFDSGRTALEQPAQRPTRDLGDLREHGREEVGLSCAASV